jgi:hypothetical protein
MPTDQRAPEREESLVNVGSLLVAHSQAAKLVQPGKCTLNDPPPMAQATLMRRAPHGEQRENMASSQALTDGLRAIRTVAEEAVRTAPRSPSLALERRNRIDERQRFFRVMPVSTGQADGEGYAAPVADYMAFALAWPGRLDSDPPGFHHTRLARSNYESQQALEYACHEGNYALRNMLSAARAAETAVGSAAPTVQPER